MPLQDNNDTKHPPASASPSQQLDKKDDCEDAYVEEPMEYSDEVNSDIDEEDEDDDDSESVEDDDDDDDQEEEELVSESEEPDATGKRKKSGGTRGKAAKKSAKTSSGGNGNGNVHDNSLRETDAARALVLASTASSSSSSLKVTSNAKPMQSTTSSQQQVSQQQPQPQQPTITTTTTNNNSNNNQQQQQLTTTTSAQQHVNKRARTTRACDPCRKKRIKCSGEKPCKGCRSMPDLCHYSAAVKRRPPSSRKNKTSSLEKRMDIVERILDRLAPSCITNFTHGHEILNLPWLSALTAAAAAGQSQPKVLAGQPSPKRIKMDPSLSNSSTNLFAEEDSRPGLPNGPQYTKGAKKGGPESEGSLLTDPEGSYYIYFGSTSALGGAQNANIFANNPKYTHGILTTSSRLQNASVFYVPPPPTLQPLTDFLPCPPALTKKLCEYYFMQFHPMYPMLDQTWFMKRLEELENSGVVDEKKDWGFVGLLVSVVCVMLQFTPSLAGWEVEDSGSGANNNINNNNKEEEGEDGGEKVEERKEDVSEGKKKRKRKEGGNGLGSPEDLARICLTVARKILYEHLEKSEIMLVQAMVLLALSAQGRKGKATASWTFAGMAVRKAQELGLHRNLERLGIQHPGLDEKTLDARRKTWFCVLIVDGYVSLMSGRPLAIHPEDWDTDEPKDFDDLRVLHLIRHAELAQIIGSICRYANRAQPLDREGYMKDVQARMEDWMHSLDSMNHKDLEGGVANLAAAPYWDPRLKMTLVYHAAIILFRRTAFKRIDDEVCVSSALAITQLISALPAVDKEDETCFVVFPTITYCIMSACTVWISKVVALTPNSKTSNSTTTSAATVEEDPEVKKRKDAEMKEVLGLIEHCLKVLKNLKSLSLGASRGWWMLSQFLHFKGIKLNGRPKMVVKVKVNEEDSAAAGGGKGDGSVENMRRKSLASGSQGPHALDKPPTSSSSLTKQSSSPTMLTVGTPTSATNLSFIQPTPIHPRPPSSAGSHASFSPHPPASSVSPSPQDPNTHHHSHVSSSSSSSSSSSMSMSGYPSGGGSGGGVGSGVDVHSWWDGLNLFDVAALGGLAFTEGMDGLEGLEALGVDMDSEVIGGGDTSLLGADTVAVEGLGCLGVDNLNAGVARAAPPVVMVSMHTDDGAVGRLQQQSGKEMESVTLSTSVDQPSPQMHSLQGYPSNPFGGMRLSPSPVPEMPGGGGYYGVSLPSTTTTTAYGHGPSGYAGYDPAGPPPPVPSPAPLNNGQGFVYPHTLQQQYLQDNNSQGGYGRR
ncbi:hypothetical protein HDV05_004733 [Chytridiales sp. JEL 0842]|nr:hypothetical protein HDV05_004733 [Chytridiales sp. JEL 0842]